MVISPNVDTENTDLGSSQRKPQKEIVRSSRVLIKGKKGVSFKNRPNTDVMEHKRKVLAL